MPTIRIPGPAGGLLARDNWVIAFFLPDPFLPAVAAVRAVFDHWRATVPADTLKWAIVGASAEEVKPVESKTLTQCGAMLDPAKAGKRKTTAFDLFGPEPDCPGHRFEVVGHSTPAEGLAVGRAGLVEARFPTEFLSPAAVVEFAGRVAMLLPYVSGYVAPALGFGPGVNVYDVGRAIRGLAFRHPGYDVPRNEYTRFDLGDRSVGARWLTFLGPQLVEHLGGRNAIAAADPGVTVAPAGQGVVLQAGAEPEIGDVNRRVGTPLLRVVARAIEPVTMFENRGLEAVFGDDPDTLERWERRFLT